MSLADKLNFLQPCQSGASLLSWDEGWKKAPGVLIKCWKRKLCVLIGNSVVANPLRLKSSGFIQSTLKEIHPEYSLEGLMLKLKLQYFGHLMRRADSFEETLMPWKIEGKRRGWQRTRWLHNINGHESEQPADDGEGRETWHAAFRGGEKTWTRLSDWTTALSTGFPGGSVVRNLPGNAWATGDSGPLPGSGRSPGGGSGNLLQYSCLGNPRDRGAWWATVRGAAKSQTRLND